MCLLMPYVLQNSVWKGNWRGGKWSARNSPQSVSSAAFLNAQPVPHQPRRMASGPDVRREEDIWYGTVLIFKKALFPSEEQKGTCSTSPLPRFWVTGCFTPEQGNPRDSDGWFMTQSMIRATSVMEMQFPDCCCSSLTARTKMFEFPGILKTAFVLRRNVINLFYCMIVYLNLQKGC